jgi:hypothetical protein
MASFTEEDENEFSMLAKQFQPPEKKNTDYEKYFKNHIDDKADQYEKIFGKDTNSGQPHLGVHGSALTRDANAVIESSRQTARKQLLGGISGNITIKLHTLKTLVNMLGDEYPVSFVGIGRNQFEELWRMLFTEREPVVWNSQVFKSLTDDQKISLAMLVNQGVGALGEDAEEVPFLNFQFTLSTLCLKDNIDQLKIFLGCTGNTTTRTIKPADVWKLFPKK